MMNPLSAHENHSHLSFLEENTEPVEEKTGISSSTSISAEEKVAPVSEKTNIPNTKDSNGTKPDESLAESLNEENISDFVDMSMIEGDKCPEENEKKQPSNILRLRARKTEIDPLRSSPREAQSVSSSTNKTAVVSQRKLVKLKRVPYKCAQCNKSYALKNSLKSHIKRVHNACMEKCPKCPKVLRSQYLWKTHILTHTCEKPFECDKCPKAYSTPLKLRLHKETHVPLDQRYKYECDVCGKKFTS
ncbi:UNVERIFIED_CONTAM: hypothetical protein GTU68_053669, partial [Idotea baltica]|nr:hypothetical protein [Idotea baltica]